jgi:AcrR family transcriptional regulator
VPNRSNAQEEKRRLLLDAAVRVFARKGYHASRVGDIAEEAGVAYGLLYHYFASKEEVLRTVFRET